MKKNLVKEIEMRTEKSILKSVQNASFGDGLNLKHITEYDGISMWWFIDFGLYIRIKRILEDPTRSKPKRSGFPFLKRFSLYWEMLYDTLIHLLCISLAKKPRVKDDQNSNEKRQSRKVLYVTQNKLWKEVYTPQSGRTEKKDVFYDSIMNEILDDKLSRSKITGTFLLASRSIRETMRGIGVWNEKMRFRREIAHKPFEMYSSWNILFDEISARNYFRKIWHDLEGEESFKKIWKFEDIDLYESVRDDLPTYFYNILPRMVKYIKMAELMVANESPDAIVIVNEYGPWERAIIVAAKAKQIPTVAIQHGNITPESIGYMHSREEISSTGSVRVPYCPLPDVTAVHGNYHKEILTKESAYPEERVVVTGHPMYDVMASADRIFDKNQLLKKLNLDSDKKIILWTTQSHVLPKEENVKNIAAVFDAMNGLKSYQLVVKLHPGEDRGATLYRMNRSYTPAILGKEAEILALIYLSDLVITKYSTSATEAIALNKPVIIMNLSGEPDLVDYVRDGVAFGVYNAEDLRKSIEKLMEQYDGLSQGREKYLKSHLYKVDGKARNRIVSLIKGLTDKSKGMRNDN
jgi:hypothetical protein